MVVRTATDTYNRKSKNAPVKAETSDPLPQALRTLVALVDIVQTRDSSSCDQRIPDNDEDWLQVIELANRSRLLPAFIRAVQILDPSFLEENELEQVVLHLEEERERCDILLKHHAKIIQSLETKGVTAVTYKGPILSQIVYDDPYLRQFRDLDVLVSKDQYETAITELQNLGHRIELSMRMECHLIAEANGHPHVVDLHQGLIDSALPSSRNLRLIWDHLEEIEIGENRFLTFASEGHLFISCTHLVKDWHNHDPFLKHAIDVAMFLRKKSQDEWQGLLEKAGAFDVGAYAKLSFTAAAQLLERPFGWIWEQERNDGLRDLSGRLLQDLSQVTQEHKSPNTRFYSARSIAIRRALSSNAIAWLSLEVRLLLTQLFFVDVADQRWVPLPRQLHFLYVAVRPIRVAVLYLTRHLKPS